MTILWQVAAWAPGALIEATLPSLWRADPYRSPFCAPAYLAEIAALARADGAEPLVAWGTAVDGSAVAAWPLRVERGGTVRMLQTEEADHCTCIARAWIPVDALAEGLALALREGGGSALFLKDVPSWGPTLEATRRGVAAAQWKGRTFAATPCPVLRVQSGAGAAEALRQKANGSHLQKRENRLKKLPGYGFEAIEGDADLDAWAQGFCDTHELRWNATATPSEYRFPEQRRRFVKKLLGWCRAGVLVRFGLSIGGERVAFAVGLVAGDRLVYHHAAFSPAHAEHSPMTMLIRRIILWMEERGGTCMDFGIGGEAYKWRFADVDEPLWRVAAAPHRASATLARGLVEERIRASKRLQALWDEWVNRRIRGALASQLDRSRTRLRRIVAVDARQPLRALLGRARSRLQREQMLFFEAPAGAGLPDPEVVLLPGPALLTLLEEEVILDARGRARYLDALRRGHRPFGVVRGGRAVQVCWLRKAEADEMIPGQGERPVWVIADCVTARRARGQALYAKVLRAIRAMIPPEDACVIYTNDWNVASQRGILKAGFHPVSIRERRKIHGDAVETRWLPVRFP